MALLTISDLKKRAAGKWVLWDVHLELDFAQVMAVFGKSDSGKTTLAGIVAGLEAPTSGSVTLGEEDDPATCRVSLALSRPAAAPELTVYENLNLFASLWSVPRKKRVRNITSLMEMMRLTDWRATRARYLSSGALARLEIARALLAGADLLVIDGLLDSLDPHMLDKLWEHLLSLRRNERKSALIFTTSGRVAERCGRMAVLHRGRINFIGRPDDFRRLAGEDMVVLGDLNDPAMRSRIQQQLSVVIQEQEGFLSFRVANGERAVRDLLAEFGSELGCVYLKRPTLDDALEVLATGRTTVTASVAPVGDRESPEG